MGETAEIRAALPKRVAQIVFSMAIFAAFGFAAAGTLVWPRLWFYCGLALVMLVPVGLVVARRNPAVIVGRSRLGEGTRKFEKVILPLYSAATISAPVLGGVELHRLARAPLSLWLAGVGVLLFVLGYAVIAGAMWVNPYMEQTVRIQHERGHKVVSTGVYSVVRHPMYAGTLLQHLSLPLILGSRWAFAAVAASAAVLVVRTVFEDRFLREELPGYADYAKRTRYRILPFIS